MLAVVEMVLYGNSPGKSAEMSCIHTVEKKTCNYRKK